MDRDHRIRIAVSRIKDPDLRYRMIKHYAAHPENIVLRQREAMARARKCAKKNKRKVLLDGRIDRADNQPKKVG